ncbi:MAG: undecaprenyl-diphosphate phosphatase [Cyanophyceae cyanobacterium]
MAKGWQGWFQGRSRGMRPSVWGWLPWLGVLGLGVVALAWGVMDAAIAVPEAVAAGAAETLVTPWRAVVLGLVQGLTEFLPISSTAHLKVVPVLLGWGDPGSSFTAAIQLGSIVAVLGYFREDLLLLGRGSIAAIAGRRWRDRDLQISLGILAGTVPIVVGGLLIKALVADFDQSPLRSLAAIAAASIGMALLLGMAEIVGRRDRHEADLTLADGLWIGLAQMLALVPGVSRSGSTLTAGLLLGIDRASAARFSFLLGIPAITLAGLVELPAVFQAGDQVSISGAALGAGLVSALISSYATIALLLKFLKTQSTWVFVGYRLFFGAGLLLLLAQGTLVDV